MGSRPARRRSVPWYGNGVAGELRAACHTGGTKGVPLDSGSGSGPEAKHHSGVCSDRGQPGGLSKHLQHSGAPRCAQAAPVGTVGAGDGNSDKPDASWPGLAAYAFLTAIALDGLQADAADEHAQASRLALPLLCLDKHGHLRTSPPNAVHDDDHLKFEVPIPSTVRPAAYPHRVCAAVAPG